MIPFFFFLDVPQLLISEVLEDHDSFERVFLKQFLRIMSLSWTPEVHNV